MDNTDSSQTANNPDDIIIKIYHPDISVLSNQTLNRLNKDIARLLRKVQFDEIESLIESFELPSNVKQSLKDKVKNKIPNSSVYYIEHIGKGSFLLEATIAGTLLLFLLKTLLKSITSAWEKSDISEDLEKFTLKCFNKFYFFLKKRNNILIKKVKKYFLNYSFSNDRFIVSDVSVKKSKGRTVISIELNTEEEFGKLKQENLINNDYLIKEIKKEINKLS